MIDSPQAEVFLLADTKSVFVASELEVTANYVRAIGRFRRRYGSTGAWAYAWGPLIERHWPWHTIREVRKAEELAA